MGGSCGRRSMVSVDDGKLGRAFLCDDGVAVGAGVFGVGDGGVCANGVELARVAAVDGVGVGVVVTVVVVDFIVGRFRFPIKTQFSKYINNI